MDTFKGRTIDVPARLTEIIALAERGHLSEAQQLVERKVEPMPWMERSIICYEIVPRPLYSGEFELFPENYGSCSEFGDHHEFFDYRQSLVYFPGRTLIFGGRFDHLTPASAMEKMARKIPNNFLYLDHDIGHQVFDKPYCFINMINTFVDNGSNDQLRQIAIHPVCSNVPKVASEDISKQFR